MHVNNVYAPCPGEPGFNCSNYPESNLLKNPQIVNLKVSPSIPKVGDTFTVTATLINNSTVPIVVDGGKCSAQDTQAEIFTIILDNHVKNKAENINCAGVGWSPLLDPGKNITGTNPDYTTNYVATEPGTATITVTFSYHTIIQRDPIQTSDEQTISKSFQFQIHDVNADSSGPPVPIPSDSPLKQFKSGVNMWLITCKPGFYFVLKAYDREPICLKAETISKLASRGFLFATNTSNDNHTTVIISPGSENQVSHHTYSPDVVTVVLGANNTVRWVNQADVANEIVPDMPLIQNGKSFGSDGVIKPDQSYTFTFTEPGIFAYHTEPHPWMKGTIIVLPQSSNFVPFTSKTYNLKQVHYYDSSNLNPKVSLYDYSYGGIDKDGLVSIGNQTFYQITLDNDIYKLKGISQQFHNVTFSFPEGTLATPGGAFINLDVKFQDGFEEIYGGTTSNPDGSGGEGGIPIPTQYGPHLATNSITVLGNHTMPQAGLTIYHDKVKLLVSNDPQTSPTVPQCVSNIQNQYAIAGFRGDPLCPVVNFQASGKIVNYTGFYGVYGYSAYPGTSNFVLEPGHNGTIVYRIDIGSIYNWGNESPANHVNITNDIEFIHDAGMRDHPGVTTVTDSKSEIIQKNSSTFVTITFVATTDARPGTYWIHLPPGLCSGGDIIILTITNCEK